jgi:prepilin-type N-terminal cleavage/methylation domain-containing protein
MQLQSYKSIIGYTLIEILVAMTIIGILFGVGYVSFRDFSRRQTLNGVAKEIQGDLRLAQGDALSGQKPDDVRCNSPNTLESYSFNVYSASEYKIEADCLMAGAPTVVAVKDVNLPAGVSISTPSPNPIKFKILGQGTNIASGENAQLTLSQTGTTNQVTITISSGGEIK